MCLVCEMIKIQYIGFFIRCFFQLIAIRCYMQIPQAKYILIYVLYYHVFIYLADI